MNPLNVVSVLHNDVRDKNCLYMTRTVYLRMFESSICICEDSGLILQLFLEQQLLAPLFLALLSRPITKLVVGFPLDRYLLQIHEMAINLIF